MKKYTAVIVTALILATPALKAGEVGIGVPLFTYRTATPIGVGVSGVPQAQLPVYQPGVVTQAPAPQAPAPAQQPTQVAVAQPDGTLRLVTIVAAPPAQPAPLVKKKEVIFGPRLTLFSSREW